MMTLVDLNKMFPQFWVQKAEGYSGPLLFAVVCTSGRRVVLWPTLEIAKQAKSMSCGRGCQKEYHVGYRLEPAAPQPKQKVSRWFKQMVEEA